MDQEEDRQTAKQLAVLHNQTCLNITLSVRLYFFETITIVLGGAKSRMQLELVLVARLHKERQVLALQWLKL